MSDNDFSGVKQLRRSRDGRVIAGVASGLGRYIGIDPNIIRVALAVASFFGGLGVAIYAIGWLLLPAEDRDRSILQDLIDKNRDNPAWVDAKAKAERGWSRATGQWGPQGTAPGYPAPEDSSVPKAAREDDGSAPRA
ncbi:hypothetical protein GCM10017673_45650 [Streptosporangium violaceochromogenes]|nr:hypothetical protein GCM10017673_45650 [Streptosporangium violaceochromogenes]